MLAQIKFLRLIWEEQTMLRTFAIAVLATTISVGLADAKGHKAPPNTFAAQICLTLAGFEAQQQSLAISLQQKRSPQISSELH
jgi:hypothetical protein